MTYSILLFNKPFQVMSQFSESGDKQTLADFIQEPGFYPAGRLDYDSEGLLILTNHGPLQHALSHPDHKLAKTYWVQVEGEITDAAINHLSMGVELKDGLTKPATAKRIEPKNLWERHPPIRERKEIPTSWISLSITEGKNRQVRRMTAAVGYPTLRLIRYAIGPWTVDQVAQGQCKMLEIEYNLPTKKHAGVIKPLYFPCLHNVLLSLLIKIYLQIVNLLFSYRFTFWGRKRYDSSVWTLTGTTGIPSPVKRQYSILFSLR